MNFRHRNNRSVAGPFLVTFFLIVIFSLPWTNDILFKVGSPLWSLKNSVTSFFINNISVLNSKTSLSAENNLLKEQIKSDQINQVLFNLLKTENEELKDILNRKSNSQNILLSAILVKPFLSPYDTFVIDVGEADGVVVLDKVVVDGNIFIGYISEVYDNASKVILYSSPGEKVKVLIGNNNIEKEAIGLGNGNFKVEMPREDDIKEGDSIVIPSIVANIFGIVERIEFKESDSFRNILFKYPININELKWVEVVLSNKK